MGQGKFIRLQRLDGQGVGLEFPRQGPKLGETSLGQFDFAVVGQQVSASQLIGPDAMVSRIIGVFSASPIVTAHNGRLRSLGRFGCRPPGALREGRFTP